MTKKNLFFEIGTEDLPSKKLDIFSKKLLKNIEDNLIKSGISFSSIKNYYTNIRLIFYINDIDEEIIIGKKFIKGPPMERCYDKNNKATNTGLGFAKKYGVKITELEKKNIKGKEYLVYEKSERKIKIKDIIAKILEDSIDNIEDQKKMRWGDSSVTFIRPIRWMTLLLGDKHVPARIMGVKCNEYTFGNKSISNKKIKIDKIEDYKKFLEKENIEIDQEKRKALIKKQINTILLDYKFDQIIDDDLVDEVASMVEYPYVFMGKFPEQYLNLPSEVLKYVIQDTQKYFLIYKNRKLVNFFIGISNVKINENIIIGNERVINPRLDDAQFFISKDLTSNIFEKQDLLKKVIFHKKLGSMYDKVQRIKKLSLNLKQQNRENDLGILLELDNVNEKVLAQIVDFSKLDLLSNMVIEIPKLQGYMGCYYAREKNILEEIALGIKDHYAPRHSEDNIPNGGNAAIVSIADKIDTVVGMFLVNEKPTGTRDPLGIRRATNGILRIILEKGYDINLTQLLNISCGIHGLHHKQQSLVDCYSYFNEKLISIFKENFTFKENIILSVVNNDYNKNIMPWSMLKKIEAINNIVDDSDYLELIANAKRVANILKKSDLHLSSDINENLLRELSEKILYNAINDIKDDLQTFLKDKNYAEYLKKLNTLNFSIKSFFDEVMINAEEKDIKLNRLSLLELINNYYNNLANIAIIGH
jgi:glycyl-tRNA synthetase beta chain